MDAFRIDVVGELRGEAKDVVEVGCKFDDWRCLHGFWYRFGCEYVDKPLELLVAESDHCRYHRCHDVVVAPSKRDGFLLVACLRLLSHWRAVIVLSDDLRGDRSDHGKPGDERLQQTAVSRIYYIV